MKKRPEDIFRKHGGQLRMSEAIQFGITRYMLYSLKEKGVIEQVTRGVYRLAELPPISNPDLVTVSLRFPNAVICLISALVYHELTTQIPREINVAVTQDSRRPSLDHPPIQAYKFSHEAYRTGIEVHRIDNVPVKIYKAEKTLVDCFKFRNKIGLDVFLEALKLYKARRKFDLSTLIGYARICRVESQMRPYLEALV